jgi:asparagine synthase (glutamine-hydrolysing)
MCGITGFISQDLREKDLHRITRTLQHRGPDAEGFYYSEESGVGLGHRRLSILDLSAAANQPFYSHDGRYIMVYNGEVYNFRELAKQYDITPRTTGDSEIILECFAKVGMECVQHFNGMFAIAIFDTEEEKLYLIRDRIGIKPLYYYLDRKYFVFGSELKALYSLPLSKAINHDAVSNFLYLGYIPGDDTIYKYCNKIRAGYYGVYTKGKLILKPYWQPENHVTAEVLSDEKEAKKQLKQLLESSVKYCMISDVPVGIFLSGGTDSSVVAAIAQSSSSLPVRTFSIGFKEKKYNESEFARAVANHIRSDHHEFTVTEQDALQLVENLTAIYDEPYADSSAIPTLLVSQLARKHVTVALSGDGGDELFMGYGFYYWARRLENPVLKAFRRPIAKALHAFGNNRYKRASKLFEYPSEERRKSHIFSQEQYFFTENEIGALLVDPVAVTLEEDILGVPRKLTVTEQQTIFDLKNYLPEELLVKTDRASMCHSLEVRVPLLDHRLVEFALNLSPDLKLKNNTGKYLLKQALYDYVPANLFDRPKWGFAVPLQLWLTKELRYLIDRYLDKATIEHCNLVHYEPVKKLKDEFFAGKGYLYNRIWALIQLHTWFIENMKVTPEPKSPVFGRV